MRKSLIIGFAMMCCIGLTACGQTAGQLNNTGIEYYNASEYEKAVDAFLKAVDKDEDKTAEYSINLGMAYLELGNYEDAGEAFETALSYEEGNLKAIRGLGVVNYFSGNYAQAMEYFGTIISSIKREYDDITLEALQYYASLQSYYGDSAGALDSYTILIRKDYNVAQQYFLRGSIYAEQGMENEAVKDYEEALKYYKDDYEIYYNIYYNFMQAGFTDRAVSYLKRALEVDGADNLLKGETYYIIGDYENAKKYLSRATDDGNSDAEYYLAMTYERLEEPERAAELYESYIKTHPSDARVYNQYGMYYYNKCDYSTALQYFTGGLALDSEEARQELMFNQACCYEYLYEYATARVKFEAYLREYPDDVKAQHEYEFLSSR